MFNPVLVFVLEIGCEDASPHILRQFFCCPESPAAQFFFVGFHHSVIYGVEDEHQFAFSPAFEEIESKEDGFEIEYAQFFPHFSPECFLYRAVLCRVFPVVVRRCEE